MRFFRQKRPKSYKFRHFACFCARTALYRGWGKGGRRMRIIYLGHSGFMVETGAHRLLFDFLGNGLEAPAPGSGTLAFVSHAHSDHLSKTVLDWAACGRVNLLAGMDVPPGQGLRMAPGETVRLNGGTVCAYGSTDAGVSFLVEYDGAHIFHAGDFNFWHWRAEADESWLKKAEDDFTTILETLRAKRMDVAFFPVDPRMGEGYDEGALRFAEAIRPAVLIPMHFWDQPQAALDFAEKPMPEGVRVIALTMPGQEIIV